MVLQLSSGDGTPPYNHNSLDELSSLLSTNCKNNKATTMSTFHDKHPPHLSTKQCSSISGVAAKYRFVCVCILILLSALFSIVFVGPPLLPGYNNHQDFFSAMMMMMRPETGSSSASSHSPKSSSFSSKYSQFQALGLSIYTGGAPYYHKSRDVDDDDEGERRRRQRNKECIGKKAVGQLDADDDAILNTAATDNYDHLYCYMGEDDTYQDVARRLDIVTQAVERAHQLAHPSPHILKIFNVPEFFWRGKDGAYYFDETNIPASTCGAVCQILMGLENLIAHKKYQDWLFLFGTIITAERLPSDDPYDYLFLNFAPVYKGFDPSQTTHVGQRFLVPKRYVSNIDFLTPLRQHFNKTLALEIIENDQEQYDTTSTDTYYSNDTTVFNPFLFQGRYSNSVWDSYKEELTDLEYTMIEYGWLVMDGIVLTLEVCLDHDMATALNSYTADAVKGRKTRIPYVDSQRSSIEYKSIPASMAQLSLVSSAGMTVNKASIATTHNGYVFLQDGLKNNTPSMYVENDCYVGLSFEGGTELVSRHAVMTRNDAAFQYSIHTVTNNFPVYDPRFKSSSSRSRTTADTSSSSSSSDWKSALKGVFSTTMYEPTIVVYPPLDIPGLA